MSKVNLFGWREDPQGIKEAAREAGTFASHAGSLIGGEERNVYLWRALLKCHSKWRRGAQGIGDCVSWGAEGASTVLMATQALTGEGSWEGEAATEPIYGGCRVEALNKRSGGWSDGAFGYAAAKWLRDGGVLLRKDYGPETGNREHDLRKYSKTKAKDWGNYGCGGQNDRGKLDEVAKKHPCTTLAQIKRIEDAVAAITNAYPLTIASMAGFGNMKRDSQGLCYWTGTWAHQMFVWGLRWVSGRPQFRICQSWGDSCSGPDPGIEETLKGVWSRDSIRQAITQRFGSVSDSMKLKPILPFEGFPYVAEMALGEWNPVSACSWWCNERDMAKILSSGDCWAISGVEGFKPQRLRILEAAQSWN